MARALDVVGRWVGRLTEQAMRAHHRRRLRRTGHLQPGQTIEQVSNGSFPPRIGNAVEMLIDGEDAFAAMVAAIESARSSICLTGWVAQAGFAMERADGAAVTLGAALARAGGRGVRSRVLLWAGAPLPAIHPTRADADRFAAELNAIEGVRCVLDAREYLLNCHHEKMLIVDGRLAFVGGLDLSDLKSDRWDSSSHPDRPGAGWHDAAIRVEGPVVADCHVHFAQRWAEIAGEELPPPSVPPLAGQQTAQLVRTIPERVYRFLPEGDFGVLQAYVAALRGATRFVVLENQFLWAVEVVDLLVEKLRHPPSDDFRLVVTLPDKAHTGQDATLGQLSRLFDADDGAGRLLAATVQSMVPGHRVYVHSKVSIVDDTWLTVGSANLNAHSLFNDTEVNLVIADPVVARSTRERLWLEHTGVEAAGVDPIRYIDEILRPLCQTESERRAAKLPPTARIRRLDQISRRADLMLGPISSIVIDS